MPNQSHLVQDAEVAIGATGAVIATNQILKAADPDHEDKIPHLVKAGIGAAIAVGAWELLQQDKDKIRSRSNSRSPSRSRSRSRSRSDSQPRSRSPHVPQHARHIFEEILGAYALGKEILGDRKHHVAHLIGTALGTTGLIQDLMRRDKAEEEEKRARR